MLAKQQAVEGECNITTVLFDNNYELPPRPIDIRAVSPITEKEYQVGGTTALLDAIGMTIHRSAMPRSIPPKTTAPKSNVCDYHGRRREFQPEIFR